MVNKKKRRHTHKYTQNDKYNGLNNTIKKTKTNNIKKDIAKKNKRTNAHNNVRNKSKQTQKHNKENNERTNNTYNN